MMSHCSKPSVVHACARQITRRSATVLALILISAHLAQHDARACRSHPGARCQTPPVTS